jgi:hypothetical protein
LPPLFLAHFVALVSGDSNREQGGQFFLQAVEKKSSLWSLVQEFEELVSTILEDHTQCIEGSECYRWTGRFLTSNGFRTPVVMFGPFGKYGKSASLVVWTLIYKSDPQDGFVVMNTCKPSSVCLNPDHLVAVPRRNIKIFSLLKESGLVTDKIFTPGGTGYVNLHLEKWYAHYREQGLIVRKTYKKKEGTN